MTRKQKGLFTAFFSILFLLYIFPASKLFHFVSWKFLWCQLGNGGKRSEWTSDDDHCGPEYLVPQENRKTGGPSCADACCKNHDICCSPGGNDLPNSILLTKNCNKQIVACLAKCNRLDSSCSRGVIPVPSVAVFAAMDLVQNWCCGSPCPKTLDKDTKNNDDDKYSKLEAIKLNNLRHSNGKSRLSEAITMDNRYLLSTAFSDEKCTAKDEVSTIATMCNSCEMLNKTASTIVRCLGTDVDHSNSITAQYCSQEFYENSDCSGEPVEAKNTTCDDTCDVFAVTKTDNDSKKGVVVSEDEILTKMTYPIVKVYTSDDCTGSVQSYLVLRLQASTGNK